MLPPVPLTGCADASERPAVSSEPRSSHPGRSPTSQAHAIAILHHNQVARSPHLPLLVLQDWTLLHILCYCMHSTYKFSLPAGLSFAVQCAFLPGGPLTGCAAAAEHPPVLSEPCSSR